MAESATATTPPPLGLGVLAQLNARQKLTAMALVAFAIALLVGAWLWTREPPYGVLFSNLSDQDGGQIVAALQQKNVPYRISPGGGAILVPAARVHDVRLQLASQGLPRGGLVGFELMEKQKLGISQFAEQVNYQRGLEGELSRSIQALGAVRAARVHLAIPKQTAFLRDELKPSASVLVSLQPGRALDPAQIAGIVHLVSSSVPQLSPANVSVIDQDGKLISQRRDGLGSDGLDPGQLAFLREVEAQYVRRIETMLEPLLGTGNFRTQVAAEIDFNQIDQVEETYQPNPAPNTAIRSQQTAETGSGSPPAAGVPGALTNQPPVPATAPIVSPPVGAAAGAGAAVGNFTRNATTNFELDKTVRHTRATPGSIKRLSVAVAVNHKRPAGSDGRPGKPVPPSAEELKRIHDLVRESVGFSEKRGDTINVAAASFVESEIETLAETPLWQDPSTIALAKEIGKYLVFALIALLIWTKLLKPVFEMFAAAAQRAEAERKAAAAAAAVGATAHAGGAHGGRSLDEKLQGARDSAKQEPKLVAELIKEWMGGSGT
jgi:flagellar M-ring protein FliF